MTLAVHRAAEYWKLSAGFKGLTLVKVLIEDQILLLNLNSKGNAAKFDVKSSI